LILILLYQIYGTIYFKIEIPHTQTIIGTEEYFSVYIKSPREIELETELGDAKEIISQLEAQLDNAKQETKVLNDNLKNAEKQIQTLENQIRSLKEEIEALNNKQ